MAIANLQKKIQQARKAGYSDEQIQKFLGTRGEDTSLVSQAMTVSPPTKDVSSRLAEVGTSAVEKASQAIQGQGEFAGQSAIRRGAEATAEIANVLPKAAVELLPEQARSGIAKVGEAFSGVVNFLSDKISDIPFVQKFVEKFPDAAKALEEVLGTTQAGGEIAGDILGAQGLKTGVSKTAQVTSDIVGNSIESASKLAGQSLSQAKSWVQQPLKASVETVLKETPTQKFDDYVTLAKKATENNKNTTPLEFAGTKAQEALDQIQRKLSTIGQNKSSVLDASVGRKPMGNIVVKFRQDLQNALKGKTSVEGNTKVYKDILTEAEKLGPNPSAIQVDKFIDFAQDRIYSAKRDLTVPVTDDVEAILRPIVGKLNESLKAQLPDSYRNLNSRYAELVQTRNELNTKLGAEGEKGGALMKRVFSPSDANTKKLFADVLDETGIDLVNEATLARYIMDVLGDARQKSMLEQLNLQATKPTAGSLTTRLIDYLVESANTPEELLNRARALTSDGAVATP